MAKGHTAVHSSDTHFWCEVFVGAVTWVTLEPTPGYEVLNPPPGLWKQALMLLAGCAQWALRHWLIVLIISAIIAVVFRKRHQLADVGHTLAWRFVPAQNARQRVLQTMRLLERRLRFVGLARPSGVTFTTWFRRQQTHPELRSEALSTTAEFLQLADWALYGVDELEAALINADVEIVCRQLVRLFTLAELRKSAVHSRLELDERSSNLKALNLNSSNPEVAYS